MAERHESGCARHNEPAYPNGPCDCKYRGPVSVQAGTGTLAIYSVDEYGKGIVDTVKVFRVTDGKISDDPVEAALDKAVEAIRMSDQ